MKIKQKTVADKVNELLAKQNHESSDELAAEATEPRVADFDEEEYELPQAQCTEFRKRNIKLLSEQSAKYKGKIASRKELEQEVEDESSEYYEESENDEDNAAFEAFGKKLTQLADESADSNEEEAEEEDDDVEEEEEDDDSEEQSAEDDELNEQNIVSETNRQTEIQKGVCVQNQLHIWEKLLEMRIQSQKMLTKANQLPNPEELQAVTNIETCQNETIVSVSSLLSKLLELQQTLGQQHSEHKEVKTAHKRAANSNKDEPAYKRFGMELADNFQAFRTYRNNVLLKWDDRTKVMTPGAGNKRKSAQEDYDILKKITHALNNRQPLIERAHAMKDNNNTTIATQIYDDSEFYHQQLRELIEHKANTTSNMSEVTKQYVELQKMRQKMKKKVDTRASKGRKIRYVVHNKLVNFMAPEDCSSWTEQSKNELYKSLFAA